jgi:hypothetical protein
LTHVSALIVKENWYNYVVVHFLDIESRFVNVFKLLISWMYLNSLLLYTTGWGTKVNKENKKIRQDETLLSKMCHDLHSHFRAKVHCIFILKCGDSSSFVVIWFGYLYISVFGYFIYWAFPFVMVSIVYNLGFLQFRLSIRSLVRLFHFIRDTWPHIRREIVEFPIIHLDIIMVDCNLS